MPSLHKNKKSVVSERRKLRFLRKHLSHDYIGTIRRLPRQFIFSPFFNGSSFY